MRRLIGGVMMGLLLARCATVSHGPVQRIRLSSKPSGAAVLLSGCGPGSTRTAKTPATVLVQRMATLCTLTFTHPEYGSRTVPLLRKWSRGADKNEALVADLCGDNSRNCNSASDVVGVVLVGAAVYGIATGIDRLTGAIFEQSPFNILVDFNNPIPKVAGRYLLVAVNGKGLPAATSTTRDGKCEVWIKSGSLVLNDDSRWSSTVTEEELCGGKSSTANNSVQGVLRIDGDSILLESESRVDSAVLQDDRLEVTMHFHDADTTVYTFRLSQ